MNARIQREVRGGVNMAFCVQCGQMLNDGTRFCRFCGNQQPGEQLIARLRMEAESIRVHMQQMRVQQMQQANLNQQQNQQRW
ncbi:MAG: hypothetical protein CMB55_00350 [Euryarchaeota archaeon]|nr:hypothetical protein [Euryarchaeota archaeon]